MTNARWSCLILLPLAASACGNDDIEIEGTYTSSAVWDLSAPFGRDGIGGAFADLLIEEAITTAVPGLIEDEAIDLATPLIRPPVKQLIESRLPDDLKEGGEVLVGLRRSLARVEVETELVFTEDVEGTERVTKLTIPTDDAPFVVTADMLPEGVMVSAEIDGDREARDRVKLDPYVLQVHFGDFVLVVTSEHLGKDAAALTAQIDGAIPCDAVVEEITGGDGNFELDVAGQKVRISAAALQTACDVVKTTFGRYALGMARLDSGIRLEGEVTLLDTDDDGRADTLSSDQAFEGRITLLPGPFEPRFSANFVAERR